MTDSRTSNTCAECGGPFGSHYGDCRIATGMKPKPTSKTKVYDVDLRNTRAWAAARIGTMSGASAIVAACDEALAARERASAEPAEGRIEPKMDDETVILRRMLGAAQARIMELERAPQPPSDNPNEGPVVNGLVQVSDGVLPAYYNRWKCSQCGRDPKDVKRNGCGYSQSCGRDAETKDGGQ